MASTATVTFLGGLGAIGRNCAVLEQDGAAVMLDCGLLFPDDSMPGVDAVLPDLAYLDGLGERLVACVCTHGHEDHIGALAQAVARRETPLPVYSSAFTLGLVAHRLEEAGLTDRVRPIAVTDGQTEQIGPFTWEFVPVTHSIPWGFMSVVTTSQGVIVHSGDFKLDPTPLDGRLTDLGRIAEVAADPGVRLLLADSTNADGPGSSLSETDIGSVLSEIVAASKGRRVICATFSSHVHRVQQMIDVAVADGRKVATLGLSMKRVVGLARQRGLLQVSDESMVDIEDIAGIDPGRLCIIATGSQGEPRSGLVLAGEGESKWITIEPTDTVILSAQPIPGNEAAVARLVDMLMLRGARVVTTRQLPVHTTGHGRRDELAALHRAARPEWFVPVHGTYHHLMAHAELAVEQGAAAERVLVARDGDQVVLADDGVVVSEEVTSGAMPYRQGTIVESDPRMLGDRRIIGREGVVIATVVVDPTARRLVGEPVVEHRGWLSTEQFAALRLDAERAVGTAVRGFLAEPDPDLDELHRCVRRAIGAFVNERTARRPMIVPTVIEQVPEGG